MLKQELLNRIKSLQEKMKAHSFDAYIITAEEDIWYFTNITYRPEERPFFLIITKFPHHEPMFVVPKLEESHVQKGIFTSHIISYWDYPAPQGENWYEVVNELLQKYERIGIEDNVQTEVFFKLEAKEIVRSQLVKEQRKVKSMYEIEQITFSSAICDVAMETILKTVYKGATVIEPFTLSRQVQVELIKKQEFDPITTSLLSAVWPAPLSAMPHSVPALHDRLGDGPNVAMAYYRINGYAAECERTFFLSPPTPDERELFHHMLTARKIALEMVKAGTKVADIDIATKEYFAQEGLSDTLLHRTGHGVGVQNHEAPFIAEGSDEVLEENMVITIEPGIYIKDIGGFRHSDTIVVQKNGYKILTTTPIELEDLIITKNNLKAQLKGKMMQCMLHLHEK